MNGIERSPDLYPQKLDLVREAAMIVPLSADGYRAASFLDDRILTPATRAAWLPLTRLTDAAAAIADPKPLHFIFHAGHVGSTLLSRVLDETGGVLGLREPLPLRTLAEAHDTLDDAAALIDRTRFDTLLETFLRLWSRGYPTTRSVIVKATSTAARLGPRLLAALPTAKAIYMNLAPEPYLATLLAGPNATFDLRGFGAERVGRLRRLAGETGTVLHTLSPGELAAMAWVTERLTQAQLQKAAGSRVLAVDFERFLVHRDIVLDAILGHFDITVEPGSIERLLGSAIFTRYSKAPEQYAYGKDVRSQALAQARRDHAREISAGLGWLEQRAASNGAIAGLL